MRSLTLDEIHHTAGGDLGIILGASAGLLNLDYQTSVLRIASGYSVIGSLVLTKVIVSGGYSIPLALSVAFPISFITGLLTASLGYTLGEWARSPQESTTL